jgi:hypothetical protein
MPGRETEPSRPPPSPRPPSPAPTRPTEPPRQPEPNRQYATTALEANERRLLTRAERQVRDAARQVQAEKAIADHERAQKAFHENRERLKAERLARAASETAVAKGK